MEDSVRPILRTVPLSDVLPLGERQQLFITMSVGQWDALLAAAYAHGWVLLELDADERPVAAYRAGHAQGASS